MALDGLRVDGSGTVVYMYTYVSVIQAFETTQWSGW